MALFDPSRLLFFFLLMSLAGFSAFAQEKSCTQAEHLQVEKEAVTLRNWDALYRSFRKYRVCDDVDAREGYSESIARILADHWDTLPRLQQLIEKDKSFGKFVGLDATMDMGDVATIRNNAIKHCPVGLSALCSKLTRDADDAIAEDQSVKKQKH